jgi:hypothetical protein
MAGYTVGFTLRVWLEKMSRFFEDFSAPLVQSDILAAKPLTCRFFLYGFFAVFLFLCLNNQWLLSTPFRNLSLTDTTLYLFYASHNCAVDTTS